jgi:hypothetical protein
MPDAGDGLDEVTLADIACNFKRQMRDAMLSAGPLSPGEVHNVIRRQL